MEREERAVESQKPEETNPTSITAALIIRSSNFSKRAGIHPMWIPSSGCADLNSEVYDLKQDPEDTCAIGLLFLLLSLSFLACSFIATTLALNAFCGRTGGRKRENMPSSLWFVPLSFLSPIARCEARESSIDRYNVSSIYGFERKRRRKSSRSLSSHGVAIE